MANDKRDGRNDDSRNDTEDPVDDVRADPPGPVDHGRDGGMATRENAPDVVRESDDKDG